MNSNAPRPLADPKSIDDLKATLGNETAAEIIDEFFNLVQEDIAKSLAALEKKDYDEFERQCHKIKSNVAYLGGKKLHKLCVDIENFHVEKDLQSIANIAEPFKVCCAETITALKKII